MSAISRSIAAAIAAAICIIAVSAAEPEADEVRKIPTGSEAFHPLRFKPYEAHYTSRSSVTGAFTLRARMIDDGQAISLVDIIPMPENVIVAQRRIHAASHALEFSAGPLFSWGAEYVVKQMGPGEYDWTRIPIGGGEPIRTAGSLRTDAVISDLFSPTLAALLPMNVGEKFSLPIAVPRKDGSVSASWETYEIVGKERLETPSGEICQCMLVEKPAPGGGTTALWIDAKPPYVFKRIFDRDGSREFVSELLEFRTIP